MKKSEILKNYQLSKLDDATVFIKSKDFNFAYTKADAVLKPELKGQYRYFGGLQCNEVKETEKLLEKWLCELAENALNIRKDYSKANEILKHFEEQKDFSISNPERREVVLTAMEEYADQSCEVIHNLFNKPAEILAVLEEIYRNENPKENNQFYLPDRSKFYKWIVKKIVG